MDHDVYIVEQEQKLREKLSHFFSPSTLARLPEGVALVRRNILEILGRINANGIEGYLFGGFLRDLFLKPHATIPRDVDIVVSGCSPEQLQHLFADLPLRTTRFGGLRVEHAITFDIWTLQNTWAFKHFQLEPRFSKLPSTTFLNVEGVIAEVATRPGRRRAIMTSGFFEAISQRQLAINLEENPFPALCVVRSLSMAAELDFSLNERLAAYIVDHSHLQSSDELKDAQFKHYGTIRYDNDTLVEWIRAISIQLAKGEKRIVLPNSRENQGAFWPKEAVALNDASSTTATRRLSVPKSEEVVLRQQELELGPAHL